MSASNRNERWLRPSAAAASLVLALGIGGLGGAQPAWAADAVGRMTESYIHVPMPPGFQVVGTELEGPVFADAQGHTLYAWPIASLRNGLAGDSKDKSSCTDKITTKTAGLASPYPAGLDLPELDKRKSCLAEWPAVIAGADAKPIGHFTIIARSDGSKQWAYDGHALYTSVDDKQRGDTVGGTLSLGEGGGDVPAQREPVGPPPDIPPGFVVMTTVRGRMLLTAQRESVYSSDKEGSGKSNCQNDCTLTWQPIVAPEQAQPHGEWSIVERAPGVRQWAFRKKPLYTYVGDLHQASLDGSVDNPGWQNVYTQLAPNAPKPFTVQISTAGEVVADSSGHTVYYYSCADDSADQLSCDLPDDPKAYFWAICGGFNKDRCHQLWHYISAKPGDKSDSRLWSIMMIDPATGNYAQANQPGATGVWAYRGRPVFTYTADKQPGDIEGHRIGEWQGRRNGFRVLWIRDEMYGRG